MALEELENKVELLISDVNNFVSVDKNECIKIQGNQLFEEQIKSVGNIITRFFMRKSCQTVGLFWSF